MDTNTREIYAAQFAESPAGRLRDLLGNYAKTPDHKHYVFYNEYEGECMGGMTIDFGNLSFLNDYENSLHTVKLYQFYIANKFRGEGLFKQTIEHLIELADMVGCWMYLCARYYDVKMPVIRRPEEYLEWVDDEAVNTAMLNDTFQERDNSKRLYNGYRSSGLCRLIPNREDFGSKYWMDYALCTSTASLSEDMQDALADRVDCATEPKRLSHREQRKKHHKAHKKQLHKSKRHKRNRSIKGDI